MGHAGMPFQKLFQKDTSWYLFSWHWFYKVRHVLLSYHSSFKQTSIFCTISERKTNPLSDRILDSLCVLEPISL